MEYIITDEIESIVAATKNALGLSVLNYQYGYVEELNETLAQWEKDPAKYQVKFPLVWLAEPFDTNASGSNDYDQAELTLFIMNSTTAEYKAKDRMEVNFKPVIYPIYEELLNQICLSNAFTEMDPAKVQHRRTNRYYFGENKQSVLNDKVDCMKIGQLKLSISPKPTCTPFSNF